ncbi:acetylornithine deacetylase [Zavarzinia sp. CC-PAN008]|uniref:acetylornithine deacetylase n=1 Tax=Zavarzinia sp. CC-PAN008 TaxID=3243332 RepID=UPI003F74350A
MDSIALLERLIAFPTVSRNPNINLIDFCADFLKARGAEVMLVPDGTGQKANLYAHLGPKDRPGIMLSGHSDVVPVDGQAWTRDPFALSEGAGRLYGRGTADMKGFVASALAAFDRAAGRDLAIPLNLALSHDEEIGCIGVRSLIADMAAWPVRPLMAIVGEPTSMQVGLGHKGKTALTATCCGHAAHSALAPTGLNAIHLAADFIARLRARQQHLAEHGKRDAAYDVPYSTIHVGRIAGGIALNIVPDRCTLDFEIRTIAEEDDAALIAAIMADAEAVAAASRTEFPAAAVDVSVAWGYPGLATDPGAEVVAFVAGLIGGNERIKLAFGTEGGLFDQELGIPAVVCGPGSMDQGHKPDEFVTRDQMARCDAMMDALIDRLAAA